MVSNWLCCVHDFSSWIFIPVMVPILYLLIVSFSAGYQIIRWFFLLAFRCRICYCICTEIFLISKSILSYFKYDLSGYFTTDFTEKTVRWCFLHGKLYAWGLFIKLLFCWQDSCLNKYCNGSDVWYLLIIVISINLQI